MRSYLKLILISFVFLIGVSLTHAELVGNFVLNPENPGPYEEVTVTLTSYDFDVNSAEIVWKINNKTVASGPGIKQIKLITNAVGTFNTVSAVASLADGQVFQASMNVSPSSVVLLWESPEAFTPPFYEGRSLPAEGATVRVTAIPQMVSYGKIVSPADISYSWYRNDEYVDSASGRGKQAADITLEYLSDSTIIKVLAIAPDGTKATKDITIYPHKISPLFYLYDPVLGTDLTRAINQRFETTREFSLRFVPYFFSLNNGIGNGASFVWTLDSLPIETEDNTTITLRPKENAFGSRVLGVAIENTKRILQNAKTDLNIVFDTRQ
ncbi:MAG: hypothetical protein NTW35_00460 [Candidatus Nomurabacteria bacterium]|nr:hypothetical protein [Candidatus Nomurabacteria bacterium]